MNTCMYGGGRVGGVRAGLLEGTKGIIRGFGLRIREFKGIALIMGNWQNLWWTGLVRIWAEGGCGHIGTKKLKLGD